RHRTVWSAYAAGAASRTRAARRRRMAGPSRIAAPPSSLLRPFCERDVALSCRPCRRLAAHQALRGAGMVTQLALVASLAYSGESMKHVSLAHARDHLSALVNDAAHGHQRIVLSS